MCLASRFFVLRFINTLAGDSSRLTEAAPSTALVIAAIALPYNLLADRLGMDRPGARQVPAGNGKQTKKVEETGCEVHLSCPNDPGG